MTWTDEELDAIGAAGELTIATERADGTTRTPVPIWVVRVGDEIFVRSWKGSGGAWFRQATRLPRARIQAGGVDRAVHLTATDPALRASIDRAYYDKYGRGPYVDAMVTDSAAASTLTLAP
ncbi:DUF2255 family protein [Microbacterium sp. KR10-403]|uniref:DUF2255 family protein n=1 Tax=Microbacterium sp. KR10-403 TaxID=3158581 RepID=UPI0032E4574C